MCRWQLCWGLKNKQEFDSGWRKWGWWWEYSRQRNSICKRRGIKLHGVFKVDRNSIPVWNTRAQDAWGSDEMWGQKGWDQTVKGLHYHMRDLDFTQQVVTAALSWGKTSNMEEGLEIRDTESWETVSRDCNSPAERWWGLEPRQCSRIKRKEQ